MPFTYAVIGSGRQGAAAAYDFIKFGNARRVLLVDSNEKNAKSVAQKINSLTGSGLCDYVVVDVNDYSSLVKTLRDVDSFVSAVPYKYNYGLTRAAIESGSNMTDLGGNTSIVKKQLKLNEQAKNKGVSIVPDCGMDPGLNISLITYMLELFDKVEEIKSYGAGLPQNPVPPWNYELFFNLNGLTNEYYGNAILIKNGKVTEVPCFDGFEELTFPEPIGQLEAAVTAGGLSTLPWSLDGKVQTLTNKTLRYPGHWSQFKSFSQLGLFDETPIELKGCKIAPRDFYHALIGPKISPGSKKDLGIIRIDAAGIKNGKPHKAQIELVDYYDEETGFTSMQRLTGWHASTIAILAAEGKITNGALPVDMAVPGSVIINEFGKRGITINIKS